MNTKKGKDNKCFKDRTGERHLTKEGYWIIILACFGTYNNTIQFEDSRKTILYNVAYKEISNGSISNPYHPSVYGRGYFGIGKYESKINGSQTRYYEVWKGILRRCYDEAKRKELPSYKDVSLCEEWHNFQVFSEWYNQKWK